MAAPRRRRSPRIRRAGRRFRAGVSSVRAKSRRFFGGTPRWAKPSTFTAATGVAVGTTELIFTPLPGGDSWVNRLRDGYGNFKQSGDPGDLLNASPDGNNLTTILAMQLKQNAPGSIAAVGGYGIVASLFRYFGM